MEPKPFKVGLRVRNRQQLDKWIKDSEDRTADLW
jgi:phenylacetate 2-hydroxylase